MMTAELADEFTIATADAERRDFDYLEDEGVPRGWLRGGPMRFGIAEIITGTTTYQPFRGGKRAYIVPAIPLRDGFFDDDIGDLVAWLPNNPAKWWRRAGIVDFINFEAIERAAFFREPLLLHPHPLAWLQAGGDGAVILDLDTHLSLLARRYQVALIRRCRACSPDQGENDGGGKAPP